MPDAKPLDGERNAAIRSLAGVLTRERQMNGLSPGELAELRRADPQGVLPPMMWRLLTKPQLADLLPPSGEERHRAESAWALLIRTMAETEGKEEGRSIGQVLADPHGTREAGKCYAEMRFVRLLRARTLSEIAYEARQAARWCESRGAALQFDDSRGPDGFGPFILAAALGEPAADRRAHAIARDYFANLPRSPED